MTSRPAPTERRIRAQRLLESLGPHRAEHRRLTVQCTRNHHVAEVYEAEDALVVLTSTGPRAHGRRDFVDAPHGTAHHGTPLVDDLDAGPDTDDDLPAACECGPRTLSRISLLTAIERGEHHLRVE